MKKAKARPKPANLREQHKAQTRATILEVARGQLESQGYEATTIRSIAYEAGVAIGTVLLHFDSKESLLYSAFYDDLQAISDAALAQVDAAAPLQSQLSGIVAHFFSAFARRPELYRALLERSLFSTGEWGARFRAQVHGMAVRVIELYEAAQARGELSSCVQAPVATMAFFSFYYFVLIDAAKTGFQPLAEHTGRFDALLAQHLDGLRDNSTTTRRGARP